MAEGVQQISFKGVYKNKAFTSQVEVHKSGMILELNH